MNTISTDYEKKSGWTLTNDSLKKFEQLSYVGCSTKMLPCGCGVKVDLQDIVYPVLKDATTTNFSYSNERLDAYVTTGSIVDLKRIIINADSTKEQLKALAHDVFMFEPHIFLELISADFEGLEPNSLKKEKYEKMFYKKCEFIDELAQIYATNHKTYSIEFGKGHSIRAGGDFIVLDFVKLDKSKPINSAFNHDSIITADSILTHTCLTSVFVSLNNALNDLFSNGVYENIQIYPVYDGNEAEVVLLQKNLKEFINFYTQRGVIVKLMDRGPLNQNIKLIGASVVGTTDKANRKFLHLTSGDEILVTKHLGDLSFLSHYRAYYFSGNEKTSLSTQRYSVLQEMTLSNYLIAKTINSYFPKIGERHDPDKNISFSTDISGPGIDVLFEAASASHVDLHLNDPLFLYPTSLYFSRKNHTSSTNGPIAIAGKPELISKIFDTLFKVGFSKIWKIGKAIQFQEY